MIVGSDGVFIGFIQNQYVFFDDDGVGFVLYFIVEDINFVILIDLVLELVESRGLDGVLDENDFIEIFIKRFLDKKGFQDLI